MLWHAHDRGIDLPLPDRSMDVDPVTEDESVARLGYAAMIGSQFELRHGWHVNLMPAEVLREFPAGWKRRASRKTYGRLTVTVPAPADLLAPKLRRREPRDLRHARWTKQVGLTGKLAR